MVPLLVHVLVVTIAVECVDAPEIIYQTVLMTLAVRSPSTCSFTMPIIT